MANLAAYNALQPAWSSAWAALLVGVLDLAAAAAVFLLASRRKVGREIELALEMRQSALDGLLFQAQTMRADFQILGGEVKEIREAIVGLFRHPLSAALPSLVPLAGLLLKTLKKPALSARRD
jgi:hypothetical protein